MCVFAFFSSSSFYRLLFCLWIWFFRFFILIMNLNWLGQRPLLSLWSKYWRILTSFFWNWTILVAINDLSFYSSMSFSEAVLQVLSGAVPFCPNPYSSSLNKFPIKSYLKRRKQRGLWNIRSRVDHNCKRIYGVQKVRGISHGNTAINQSRFLNCQCQPVDSVSETVGDNGNGSWFKDPTKQVSPIHSGESKKVLNFEDVQPLKNDKEVFTTNGVMCKDMQYDNGKISVEDEAWNLLRESMVYYCGSPIGTIAALDTSSSSVLNYDQVFIRDFIPSGIAFLLKGEYDIVRNFILHTLQLQVYTCSNFFFLYFYYSPLYTFGWDTWGVSFCYSPFFWIWTKTWSISCQPTCELWVMTKDDDRSGHCIQSTLRLLACPIMTRLRPAYFSTSVG